MSNASSASMLGDQRSEIDTLVFARVATRELPNHIGPDFIALPADCWAEMNAKLRGGKATMAKHLDAPFDD
jgi:hypothetical protein